MLNSNIEHFISPQFKLLSESQIKEIHLSTLEILRDTGVRFEDEKAVEILRKNGAWVKDNNLVRFPASMVEEAISSAPQRIVLCNSEGEGKLFLEDTKTFFGTGSDTLHYLDPYTENFEEWTTDKLCEYYRICDALPNIDFLMSLGIPQDVPDDVSHYQWQFAHMMQNSSKPCVVVCNDAEDIKSIIEMASVVRDSREELRLRPNILLYSEPSSPLKQSSTALKKLMIVSKENIPVVHSPAPMMGSTGPIHMAGELALCNAEILSGMVLHQLINPGAPFVYGAGPHHFEMSSMEISYGSPEFQLTKTAVAELGRNYGLPTWGYAGCSDAKTIDHQAVAETSISVLMARLGGSNLVHDIGYIESGKAASIELVVLTDELIDMTENMMQGIEVTTETLMLSQIKDVGPGGHFLDKEETAEHFRDYWFPRLFDRKELHAWKEEGRKTVQDRIRNKLEDIKENYSPKELPEDKEKEIMNIIS